MLREVRAMRWLKAKQVKLESELIEAEAELLSDTKVIKNERLVELSGHWQRFRVANEKSTYQGFLNDPSTKSLIQDLEASFLIRKNKSATGRGSK